MPSLVYFTCGKYTVSSRTKSKSPVEQDREGGEDDAPKANTIVPFEVSCIDGNALDYGAQAEEETRQLVAWTRTDEPGKKKK